MNLLLECASSNLRDYAMLSLLYDSGARVAELCATRICDVRFEHPCTIRLYGKGRKVRVIPISKQVAEIIRKFIEKTHHRGEPTEHLFLNNKNEPIGRAGVAYVLKKYADLAHGLHPEKVPRKTNPHQLRHSKAMHMLEAGVNLIYIKDFLGHSSVTTTEVYARANPEMKRKAIEEASANVIKKTRFSVKDREDLLAWLRKNI
jgi:site-specific recombinase XerD